MTTLTPRQAGTLAEFIKAGNVRVQDFATIVQAVFIQSVLDNGFGKPARSSLPTYQIGDPITARMWLRDAAVWLYNLSGAERQRLLELDLIW